MSLLSRPAADLYPQEYAGEVAFALQRHGRRAAQRPSGPGGGTPRRPRLQTHRQQGRAYQTDRQRHSPDQGRAGGGDQWLATATRTAPSRSAPTGTAATRASPTAPPTTRSSTATTTTMTTSPRWTCAPPARARAASSAASSPRRTSPPPTTPSPTCAAPRRRR